MSHCAARNRVVALHFRGDRSVAAAVREWIRCGPTYTHYDVKTHSEWSPKSTVEILKIYCDTNTLFHNIERQENDPKKKLAKNS
jgi:hypothetical protein